MNTPPEGMHYSC